MELSFFLAKVWGLFLVILSFAVLSNRKHLSRIIEEFSRSFVSIFFSGIIALVLGLLMIVSHNIWSADWRVIITILGWITLLKGVSRCLFPHNISQVASMWSKSYTSWWGGKLIVGVITIIALGVYLTYVGFSAQVW